MNDSKVKRNTDLDIVRGMLVFFMVVYHSASVISEPQFQHYAKMITDRVSFIHYAFIIISGFLCGWYYTPRLTDSEAAIRKRIFIRAVKLLSVFLALNFLFYSMGIVYSYERLVSKVNSIEGILLFLNSLPGDYVAFEVLYYIAIFLLLSSFIIGNNLLLLLAVLVSLIFTFKNPGLPYWLLYGIIGMVIGIWVQRGYFNIFWHILERTKGIPLISSLILYQIFLSPIHMIMFRYKFYYLNIFIYVLESSLWFLTFVFLFRLININSLKNAITLAGRYILIGYIVQMIVLHVIYRLLQVIGIQGMGSYIANLICGSILMYSTIAFLDYMRKRLNLFDRSYRFVFG